MSTDRSQLSRTNSSIVFRRLTTRRQRKEASATASMRAAKGLSKAVSKESCECGKPQGVSHHSSICGAGRHFALDWISFRCHQSTPELMKWQSAGVEPIKPIRRGPTFSNTCATLQVNLGRHVNLQCELCEPTIKRPPEGQFFPTPFY